jgi:lysyl-tRNA synthetase class 2
MNASKTNGLSVSAILTARSLMCDALRRKLFEDGGIEVATPILHAYPDIAPVYQFVTQHPLSKDTSCLRIAPTEFLKRLLVEGVQCVFEFATNFRSDLPDTTHMPEFTSLEAMLCNRCCRDMQQLVQELCRQAIRVVTGNTRLPRFQPPGTEKTYDLDVEWPVVSLRHFLYTDYGFDPDDLFKPERVIELYRDLIDNSVSVDYTSALDAIVEFIATSFDSPVFIAEYPYYLGGPAAPCKDDPRFKERTELFIGTLELANMSSNLIESEALKAWHETTMQIKNAAGISPNRLDIPLLEAVSRGLPLSAVFGIGIDRLLMVSLGVRDIQKVKPFNYGTLFQGGKKHE